MNPLQNNNNLTKETQTIISYEDVLFQSNLFNKTRNDNFEFEITKINDITYRTVEPFNTTNNQW